jgi:DNA replication protein DnaC
MKHAGFEKRHMVVDPERIPVREEIEQYLGALAENVETGRGLILVGDVGVGKTMALSYMARRMLVENYGVWCARMAELVDAIADRESRKATVMRLISVQILMLDDFGTAEMQPWVLSTLDGVVDKRYSDEKPTLISTNMTRDKLLHDPNLRRMVDRWRQCNRLLKFGDQSQRHE